MRKDLHRAGYDYIPVVSVNLSGLEKNPGFTLNFTQIRQMAYSMLYGDLIVLMANQCRPYEVIEGETDRRVEKWVNRLTAEFKKKGSFKSSHIRNNFNLIADDFASILVKRVPKVKVGIVGEIYVKFAPLGNNNLEEFLLSEGCEPVVQGLPISLFSNATTGWRTTGCTAKFATYPRRFLKRYLMKLQRYMIEAVKRHPNSAPLHFWPSQKLVRGYLDTATKWARAGTRRPKCWSL